MLAKGYAYAATDKGNSGTSFYEDGARPGDAVAEWHRRVTELTRAAKQAVRSRYGRPPARTYMTGISNGGYLTRWQLENHPELYDGGVDWEGTLMRAERSQPLHLPADRAARVPGLQGAATRPRTGASSTSASPPAPSSSGTTTTPSTGTSPSAAIARSSTRATTARSRAARRSAAPGRPAATPTTTTRPGRRRSRTPSARVSLTGRIGKPMLTLHGTLDALLPIRTDSDVYTRMVRAAGRGALHRYYVIEGGSHVDSRYDRYPDALRPILPCYRAAFTALRGDDRARGGAAAEPDRRAHGRRRRRQCVPARRRRRQRRRAGAGGAAKPRLRLRVTPKRVRAGRRTRLRFRVTSRGRPVRGAKVRFAGRTKRTGRRGRAVMVRRFTRPGLRRAVARKPGKRAATARVRVLRRRR